MYSMSIYLLPICLFIVISYVTLLSMEEIKNTFLLTYTTQRIPTVYCTLHSVYPQSVYCTVHSVYPQSVYCTLHSVYPQSVYCTLHSVYPQSVYCTLHSVWSMNRRHRGSIQFLKSQPRLQGPEKKKRKEKKKK